MQVMPNGSIARQWEHLFRRGAVLPDDRALLDWFVSQGDQAAFEAIVARHGPMVRGICSRLLGSPHDADDAFQATFLVLVQKARTLRDADRLGPWLYGVATRVANRARHRSARRRDHVGTSLDELPSRDEGAAADWLDVRSILDAELGRLPAKYRDVLVICLLQGFTAEEAARQLSCPLGTVKSRLARGRDALRTRLTGRGLAPALALAVAAGSAKSAVASVVPQTLICKTLQTAVAAGSHPASLSPTIVALTRGVAPSMFTKSSIVTAVVFGGLALSGLGIAAWSRTPVAAQDAEKKPAPESPNADNLRRDAAQRFQTINNLKQIMLAMHNYESTHGSFPAAAIYGKEGQPLLSWRVAILPFLEQAPLYAEFHKDEPWDSPHNKTLWGRMPNVFKTPYSPAADHATRIRGFQGAGAMFEGPKGARIADITDGTSNTIMLTVSNDAAVWTKPGDLPFIDGAEIVGLDEADPLGYLLATGDGSVHTLPKNAKGMPGLLRKMITRNGGEIIELPDAQPISTDPRPDATGAVLKPTAAVGGPGGMSAGGSANATTPPDLEHRLKSMEDKLDRILKRLDALAPEAGAVNRNR